MTKQEILELLNANLEKHTTYGMHNADYTRVAVEVLFDVSAQLLADRSSK